MNILFTCPKYITGTFIQKSKINSFKYVVHLQSVYIIVAEQNLMTNYECIAQHCVIIIITVSRNHLILYGHELTESHV